jgi:hypothetical protein
MMIADELGTNEIMRRTGISKAAVWRRQERFMWAGPAGLVVEQPVDPVSINRRSR